MYKVTMRLLSGDVWSVMDQSTDRNKAVKALEIYRKFLPDKQFRLELHTVTVLDD